MADKAPTHAEPGPELTPRQRLTRAAIGVLFYLILLIPRVRRLRRRARLWTAVRVTAGLAGFGLGWMYFSGQGAGFVAGAALLLLFGLFVRATPVVKSLEERARELGALVVLNGGSWVPSAGEPAHPVNIFAGAERLIIEDCVGQPVAEIPLAKIQHCVAQALEPGEGRPWELEIAWDSSDPQTARFRFEGFFAEHLARVAETTIITLRRRELPVLK